MRCRFASSALAPKHMATVVTMEQLAETCAAREKLFEAVALFERALPMREAALGADHATVRALRSRIAELDSRLGTESTVKSSRRARETITRAAPQLAHRGTQLITARTDRRARQNARHRCRRRLQSAPHGSRRDEAPSVRLRRRGALESRPSPPESAQDK